MWQRKMGCRGRGSRPRVVGFHSTTELDAGHPLSPSVLPPPTKMLQVPSAQETLHPGVHMGELQAQRGPPPRLCSKRGPEREQCLTLMQCPVHSGAPGTEGPGEGDTVGGVPT